MATATVMYRMASREGHCNGFQTLRIAKAGCGECSTGCSANKARKATRRGRSVSIRLKH